MDSTGPAAVRRSLSRRLLLLLFIGTMVPFLRAAPSQAAGSRVITTVAGNGIAGYGGDGGAASVAMLNQPYGLTIDGSGDLYIADTLNCRIRRVHSGIITTFAGNGSCTYGGDNGPAVDAGMIPSGLAMDGLGNLYLADHFNCRVRKIDTSGIITTVAGNGACAYNGDGSPATSISLNLVDPTGIAVDTAGNLYIGDRNNCRVRKVDPVGAVTTVAGNGVCGYAGDGGPATGASLLHPVAVAVDSVGDLYIGDRYNCRIREVDLAGTIATIAGNGLCGSTGDGGPAASASIEEPEPAGLALDIARNLYVSGSDSDYIVECHVREVTVGLIGTLAGNTPCGFSGDGGLAASANLRAPTGVAVDPAGNVYISDSFNNRVRMVSLVPPSVGGIAVQPSFSTLPIRRDDHSAWLLTGLSITSVLAALVTAAALARRHRERMRNTMR